MGYIDETTKEERTIERLIRFMKSVENPSWMVKLVEDMRDKLAEYEDLEEQGKLLKLPCTPGQSVWVIKNEKISKCVVSTIRIEESGVSFCNATYICNLSDFGRTVFRTKEEAEAELIKKTNRRKCNELEKRRKSEEKTMRLIRFMRGEEI